MIFFIITAIITILFLARLEIVSRYRSELIDSIGNKGKTDFIYYRDNISEYENGQILKGINALKTISFTKMLFTFWVPVRKMYTPEQLKEMGYEK